MSLGKKIIKENIFYFVLFIIAVTILYNLIIKVIHNEDNLSKLRKEQKDLEKISIMDDNISLAQEVSMAQQKCFNPNLNLNKEHCDELFKMNIYTDHNQEIHFGKGNY